MDLTEPRSPERRRSTRRGRSHRPAELFEPRLLVRLRARTRGRQLDRQLAAGADPSASPLLAARAAQLVDSSRRQRIANCLEQFASVADRPRGRAQTPPLRSAVRPNQEALLQLAQTLRHGRASYAHGIAMLELVLVDGTGPAYTDPSGKGLMRQLASAAQGLTGSTVRIAPR
jgi:hypothetical protein